MVNGHALTLSIFCYLLSDYTYLLVPNPKRWPFAQEICRPIPGRGTALPASSEQNLKQIPPVPKPRSPRSPGSQNTVSHNSLVVPSLRRRPFAHECAGLTPEPRNRPSIVLRTRLNTHPTSSITLKTCKPRTQCDTKATSLRKQNSKLRESDDPRHGAVHKDVHCRQCAKDGAFGGHPAPHIRSLNG